MTRLDEALRRSAEGIALVGPEPSQEAFSPAWSVPADGQGAQEDVGTTTLEVTADSSAALTSPAFTGLSSQWRECLATGVDGDPTLIEQFRRLAATLHRGRQLNGLRSVMVSSAAAGDGKTLTAVNLALVLSESYRYRVLLVDADLRRPSIASAIGLEHGRGLSEALRATDDQKLALIRISPRLTLLPAGQPIANSIEALTSPRMQHILEEAAERFDWVILDAPPVGPAADAKLLTQMVGGTLFVIRAGKTQHADVEKAIEALGREQILGVVLNGVTDMPPKAYYYGPTRD